MYEADRPPSPDHPAVPGLVYSVSDLNRQVRELLEASFPLVWVQGEVSNLARPASGHVYFSLKDRSAQVRCAMFRRRASRLGFRPADGQEVIVKATLGLYEARGEYQLIVEGMEPAGEGALKLKFEELKARLAAEGLFDPDVKRPLPKYPRRIGIVTSPTGAAVRDVLTVLGRRAPGIEAIVYPCQVQGAAAASTIVGALETAYARAEVDVLILCRGGGSLEDLWPFNEEIVARALAAAPMPVVAGVGHETDVTIADLAADLRAATPSAAAEICSKHATETVARLRHLEQRLLLGMDRLFAGARLRVDHAARRLGDPRRRLTQLALETARARARLATAVRYRLRADAARLVSLSRRVAAADPRRVLGHGRERRARLAARLRTAMRFGLDTRRRALDATARRLEIAQPGRRIAVEERRLTEQRLRLGRALERDLKTRRAALAAVESRLNALSPLSTLSRGYAIVYRGETAVRARADVRAGDRLEIRVADGRFAARAEPDDGASNDGP